VGQVRHRVGRRRLTGVEVSIRKYNSFRMPESGPKTSPSVHNGVFQTSAKLQWQWHSFLNSNGVLQKHQSYNGTDRINSFDFTVSLCVLHLHKFIVARSNTRAHF
jgi:hypothetical protein